MAIPCRLTAECPGGPETSAPCRSRCAGSRRLRAVPRAISGAPRPPPRSARGPRRASASPARPAVAAPQRPVRPTVRRGAATTTASTTAGMPSSTSSTSSALMFSPPRMMTSEIAVGDRQIAVFVEHTDVAGAVPAVIVEGPCGQFVVGVAEAQIRPPAEDLTVGTQPDLHPGPRVSVGEQPLVLWRGTARTGDRRVFGAAIRTEHEHAQVGQPLGDRRRNGRTPEADGREVAQVLRGAVRDGPAHSSRSRAARPRWRDRRFRSARVHVLDPTRHTDRSGRLPAPGSGRRRASR